MARRMAILDRDGTIIREQEYLGDPDLVELLPGAAEGLKRLADAGYALVVVTNQSGIGRGYYTEDDYARVNDRVLDLLRAEGVELDGVYYCPHAPDKGCACRKPKPALAERAAADLDIPLEDAVAIGDKASDIGLGQAIGATTILVRTGYGAEQENDTDCRPDHVVDGLSEAADVVLKDAGDDEAA